MFLAIGFLVPCNVFSLNCFLLVFNSVCCRDLAVSVMTILYLIIVFFFCNTNRAVISKSDLYLYVFCTKKCNKKGGRLMWSGLGCR